MIRLEPRTVLHCKCERCGYEWDSFRRDKRTGKLVSDKPRRCASCKYLSWNGEDRRRKNPFEFTPPESVMSEGRVPQLHPKPMLDTLHVAKKIIEQLVADYGPCEHPKVCVCEEKEALTKINRHIETLRRITGKGKTNELVAEPV